jgi:hypothetical protein
MTVDDDVPPDPGEAAVTEKEDEEHVVDIDFEQEVMPVTYDITSYGADYPVDGLVKRLNQKDIVIPSFDPAYTESDEVRGFQRRFVWGRPQMDRFIESLLLGLPVPGVFLVRERTNILLVLDGHQRLRTLQAFYRGVHGGREYVLRYVQSPFKDVTYETLDDEDRRRLDDSIIHATVLRQEQPPGNQDAVYSIFERLNTGGSPLQPQEIRVALYHGSFLRFINELNENSSWRTLYGAKSARFKDQELILRVLAFYERAGAYSRPLKAFLNHYLAENRNRSEEDSAVIGTLFAGTCDNINEAIGTTAFRPVGPLNAATLDSVMVGVMRRLAKGPINDLGALARAHARLLDNQQYLTAILGSTAAEDSVKSRLRLATRAFDRIR